MKTERLNSLTHFFKHRSESETQQNTQDHILSGLPNRDCDLSFIIKRGGEGGLTSYSPIPAPRV